jgi:replicative DNA helicase
VGKTENTQNQKLSRTPVDLEAERILLGSVIMGSEHTAELFELLTEEDFFDSRHRIIFRALKKLWQDAKPVDLAFLEGTITDAKEVESAGGIGYIASLIDGIFMKMRVDTYAARIRTKRIMRMLVIASSKIETDAYEADALGTPASKVIDGAIELFSNIAKLAESEDRGKTNLDAAVSLLSDLWEKKFIKINTGISEVDNRCGGFRSGEIGIITAETGVGKTFFALQIGRTACNAGHHMLYCSGEMLAEHLMARVLCSDSRVEYGKIRHPESLTDRDTTELVDSTGRQCKTCRILDGELSLARIRLAARTMASKNEIGGIIVDYDELVEVHGKDEWEQQRILVRSLKALAMELKIPVLIVSQLRKSLDAKDREHPTLQRLYGSGAKSKHASIILYVDRPYVQDLTGEETEARVFILKSRDGRMGMTECRFNIRTFRFEPGEATPSKAVKNLPYKDPL